MLLTLKIAIVESRVYHITPLQNQLGNSNLTLSQFAANSSELGQLHHNVTLMLLSGIHVLQTEFLLSNLTLFSLISNESSSVRINCKKNNSNLIFVDIANVHISGMEFVRCTIRFEYVDMLLLKHCAINGDSAAYAAGLEIIQTDGIVQSSSFVFNTQRGAIVVDSSNVSVIECNFTKNAAIVGGALSTVNGNITITASLFTNNKATGCEINDPHACNGGALYVNNGIIIIESSAFKNNTSEGNGGAVAVNGKSFVVQSIFQYNQALLSGGAVYVSPGSFFTLDSSSFDINSADEAGGGVFIQGSGCTIINCTYHRNVAKNCPGGALSAHDHSTIYLKNSLFNRNKAGIGGGAIYEGHWCQMTVEGSNFFSNIVGTSTSDAKDCDPEYKIINAGGALCAFSYSYTAVRNSSFTYNRALTECDGGSISIIKRSTGVVEDSYFNGNIAGSCGGAVHSYFFSNVAVHNSIFYNNSGCEHGGALCPHTSCLVEVSHSVFHNNTGAGHGGAIITFNCSIWVTFSDLSDNKAIGESGGAAFLNGYSSAFVSNSVLSHNHAKKIGGAISVHEYSKVYAFSSNFTMNNAEIDGGAIGAFKVSAVNASYCSLSGNTADLHGGAMYAFDGSNITINKTVFDNNSVGKDGGAIHAYTTCVIVVFHSQFIHNRANEDGGCLSLTHSYITIYKSFFTNSVATDYGGIISLSGSIATLLHCNMNKKYCHCQRRGYLFLFL